MSNALLFQSLALSRYSMFIELNCYHNVVLWAFGLFLKNLNYRARRLVNADPVINFGSLLFQSSNLSEFQFLSI